MFATLSNCAKRFAFIINLKWLSAMLQPRVSYAATVCMLLIAATVCVLPLFRHGFVWCYSWLCRVVRVHLMLCFCLLREVGGWKMRLQQHAMCCCCCSLTPCVNDQNDQCKAALVPRAIVGFNLGDVTAVTLLFREICPGIWKSVALENWLVYWSSKLWRWRKCSNFKSNFGFDYKYIWLIILHLVFKHKHICNWFI